MTTLNYLAGSYNFSTQKAVVNLASKMSFSVSKRLGKLAIRRMMQTSELASLSLDQFPNVSLFYHI